MAESENPELLITSPNTKPTDWWLSGMAIRMATTTRTPTMCHHADTEFSRARTLTFSRLSPSCSATMTVNVMKTAPVSVPTASGNHRFNRAVAKSADPYWMEAVTAIWPTRLNQPVNQPHAGPPSLEAQKYSAPAVGIEEAISPIDM